MEQPVRHLIVRFTYSTMKAQFNAWVVDDKFMNMNNISAVWPHIQKITSVRGQEYRDLMAYLAAESIERIDGDNFASLAVRGPFASVHMWFDV